MEKLKRVEEEMERKRKAIAELRKQYDEALQNKKLQIISEIEREMRTNEEIMKMQHLRQKLIAEEAYVIFLYFHRFFLMRYSFF